MAKPKDFSKFINTKHNKLLILKIRHEPKKILAECLCDCGKTTTHTVLSRLLSGKIKSCKSCSNKTNGSLGNMARSKASQHNILIGQTINYFTVVRRAVFPEPTGTFCCRCICGNLRFLDSFDLRDTSDRKSCGCQQSRLLSLSNGGSGIPYETTTINDIIRKSTAYDKWVKACLSKANYTCQVSGKIGCRLNVHHVNSLSTIISFNGITQHNYENFVSTLYDVENGLVLSEDIHKAIHSKYGKQPTFAQITEFKIQYLNTFTD